MIQRAALIAFLAGGPLVLSGCQALNGVSGMMNRMLSAGGRSVGIGAENNSDKPFRLETGEIERTRAGESYVPTLETAEEGERVAAR
jgi:hypothetical protein